MGNIFYISDLHMFHDKMTERRCITSNDELHDLIKHNWQKKVSDTDTVYVLGNLGMYHAEEIAEFINELPGRKILLTGNHDRWNLKCRELRKCFEEIHNYMEIRDQGRKVVLCHYPIEDWNGMMEGFFHVHGHVHKGRHQISVMDKRFNANIEYNNYAPMTLDELIQKNQHVPDETTDIDSDSDTDLDDDTVQDDTKPDKCCKFCQNAVGYSGRNDHFCRAMNTGVRAEMHDCPHFTEM